jgi:hypothetical protein
MCHDGCGGQPLAWYREWREKCRANYGGPGVSVRLITREGDILNRLATAVILAMLLCSACFSVAATAQNAEMSGYFLTPAIDTKISLLDNTLGDYLSGSASQWILPGAKSGEESVYEGHAPTGYVNLLPPGRSGDSLAATGEFSVQSINPRETLPYTAGISADYAATYIGACGVCSRTPSVLASSVYARLSPQSLVNLQAGEILVLHQWGKVVNDVLPENDIVIGRNWTRTGYVDFTIFISAYANPWVKTISCPASHVFNIYIKTVNPKGTSYNRLEFCVYDVTARKSYTYQYVLPVTQTMDGADMALEKYYADGEQRPGLVQQWRTVTAFHVYDQYQRCVDLSKSGFVCEWLTSGVETAYYHDYKYYGWYRNGDGTFYMTRYGTGNNYPSHP